MNTTTFNGFRQEMIEVKDTITTLTLDIKNSRSKESETTFNRRNNKTNEREMKEEFKNNYKVINKTWSIQPRKQNMNDGKWDKIMKTQHESTIEAVQKMVENFIKIVDNRENNKAKTERKLSNIKEDQQRERKQPRN